MPITYNNENEELFPLVRFAYDKEARRSPMSSPYSLLMRAVAKYKLNRDEMEYLFDEFMTKKDYRKAERKELIDNLMKLIDA